MTIPFVKQSFTFGSYSRYQAREWTTRFGTVEWHVTDAETKDTQCPELPALICQFDTYAELQNFVDEVEGADKEPCQACNDYGVEADGETPCYRCA